ncbi:MAG: ABC transporter permease [Phycisphaerales bacterium]|nr:ABC transporter permease [Phycisphaerales bacterium]
MPMKLYTLAYHTFVEVVRQPIYNVLLWAAALWLALFNPALAAYSLDIGSDIKIAKDVGMSTLMLVGLLMSVFAASGVISREIETRSILTVISKPVSRSVFLLGKYLGVGAAVLIAYYFLCVVMFITFRQGIFEMAADKWDGPVLTFGLLAIGISLTAAAFANYVYGWNFPATLLAWVVPLSSLALLLTLCVSKEWAVQPPTADWEKLNLGEMTKALLMVFCGVMLLNAFAIALATRLSQTMTLMACSAVFLIGLLSDYYFGRHVGSQMIYDLAYQIVPNFQFHWLGDALSQDLQISHRQVGLVAAYSAMYASAVLALGVSLFQTREID